MNNEGTRINRYQENYNKRKKRKIKWKNVILFIFFIVFFTTLTISIVHIVKWKLDNNKAEKEITNTQENVTIIEKEDTQNTEVIEPEEEIPKSNPYWDYIKMNLIDVDFTDIKRINNETVGWIQVNGTNINYPIVKHSDNNFYLTHSFNKSYNSAGWVFMDYRNNATEFDKNTIIYAHGMINNIMFGTLRKILTNGWLDNKNNYVIKLSTEYENTLWQVFSVYKIPTTNDYLKINFVYEDNFVEFANTLTNRSQYDFDTNVNKDDKILTLSTCYNDKEKVVFHAKLIKREKKQ